jgi:ribosome-binding ATPase YchF (GTP1/OBG family)
MSYSYQIKSLEEYHAAYKKSVEDPEGFWAAIAENFLLSDKPVLYVANVDEASMHTGNKFSDPLH